MKANTITIKHPYIPEGRIPKFVPHDHPFMLEAKKAREECAGDPLFPVGVVLVKNNLVVARAGNGYNKGPGKVHVCPRVVQECPTGVGYELCDLHNPEGHAEPMLIQAAKASGIDPIGGDIYMFGHWWACEDCWNVMLANGIRDVYWCEDAHLRFSRETVYAETLKPSVKTAYIAGALTNLTGFMGKAIRDFYEMLGETCKSVGVESYVPHLHSDPEINPSMSPEAVFEVGARKAMESDVTVAEVSHPSLGTGGEIALAHQAGKHIVLVSKKGMNVTRFVRGNPSVVYHIEYEDEHDACRQLTHVLRSI